MEFIKNIFFGVMMGAANVIPGVSGGTIAVIFDFYDRLLESITLNFKVIKKNLPFLIPLGLGIGIGIIGVSKIMQKLFETQPLLTYFAFIGIIIGSLPLIYLKTKKNGKVKPTQWIGFVVAILVMVALTVSSGNEDLIRYTTLTPESFIACFAAMGIATVTMLIPGVSGSMLLIIMGMYGTVYAEAVGKMNIPLLIPILLGAAISFLVGAKAVRYLLDKHLGMTYSVILGLLVGSIFQLIKNSEVISQFQANPTSTFLVLCQGIGIALIMAALIYFGTSRELKK